jgi:hypothetical protein
VPYQDKTDILEELMVKKNAPRWIHKLIEYQYIRYEGGKQTENKA